LIAHANPERGKLSPAKVRGAALTTGYPFRAKAPAMRFDGTRRALVVAALAAAACPAAAGTRHTPGFVDIPFATWRDDEPAYRFYPGDQIDVATPTAPELNRSVTVGPDGRISMPLIGPVMAADRTAGQLEAELSHAFAGQLVRPIVEVSLKQAGPQRVLVGGEVGTPGWVEMNGDLDALRAAIAAGGIKPSAKLTEVVIIRRGADGRPMRRVVDLSRALHDPAHADLVPLRRYDIVYVPRSSMAEAGVFMGQVRDLIPFGFSYNPPFLR
jgi:polysaccharide export outer membrane protein